MGKPLVFMMGRSPVFLPTDRSYARNHMWAMAEGTHYRIGLSGYAVRLLGDLAHLQWSVQPGTVLNTGDRIAFVEGSKATSDLYAPFAGQVEVVNAEVVANPTLLNSNLYDAGWLFTVAPEELTLLSAEQYFVHLEAAWPLAQRLLKGLRADT